jgi:hypothetical protein
LKDAAEAIDESTQLIIALIAEISQHHYSAS